MHSDEMLEFQHDDVIVYDISGDFKILFGICNRLLMSYPCTKLHHDTTINNGDTMGVLCIFQQNNRGLDIMISLSLTS